MIYLDNAATTFPKPKSVQLAMANAAAYAANPGRSGHTLALKASSEIYKCRTKIANFFGSDNPENVIFTLNCTHAVNIVLKGLLKPGDHVVVSDLEHNAVMRPIFALTKRGITYSEAKVSFSDSDETLNNFRNAIQNNTKLVVCTHVSNVWGIKLPIERITAMCHQYNIPVMIDAAQSAGVQNINISDNHYDFVCMPGHKGLYGPMGTGVLIASCSELPDTLIEGGTGSNSAFLEQPLELPDRFESGTPNLTGIAGLSAGLDFVTRITPQKILHHEISLLSYLYDKLSINPNIVLYTNRPTIRNSGGVLSFNVKNKDSEEVAAFLNKSGSIAVRAGLHCSPLAHRHFGTEETGAVRISPSYFNSINEINILTQFLTKI